MRADLHWAKWRGGCWGGEGGIQWASRRGLDRRPGSRWRSRRTAGKTPWAARGVPRFYRRRRRRRPHLHGPEKWLPRRLLEEETTPWVCRSEFSPWLVAAAPPWRAADESEEVEFLIWWEGCDFQRGIK